MGEEKVLIIGAGRSGIAAARYLVEQAAMVCLYDDQPEHKLCYVREAALEHPHLSYAFGGLSPAFMPTLVVLSPGVPLTHPLLLEARKQGTPVVNEIEVALRYKKNLKIIGITGTNGKSTATVMMESILKEAGLSVEAGGNLGIPLCDLVRERDFDYLVLELSSFQLEILSRLALDVAIILNITPDHLDRYASMDDYRNAKLAILKLIKPEGTAVLNDNLDLEHPQARYFSLEQWGHNEWAFLKNLDTKGLHNRENALAVALAARSLHISDEAIARGIANFRPLDFRCQFIAKKNGLNFINDSKGTTVVAVEKAIMSSEQPVHLLLGGHDKGEDFSSLRQFPHVKAFYVYGAAQKRILNELNDRRAEVFPTLEEAFYAAVSRAEAESTILLSPGCASYDQFRDYIERGRTFNDLVAKL